MAEVRLFKPADGKEAREFERAWCENCRSHEGGNGCWILFAAATYDPTDPEYPTQWILGEDGPECTHFAARLRAVGFDRVAFEQQGFARGDGR